MNDPSITDALPLPDRRAFVARRGQCELVAFRSVPTAAAGQLLDSHEADMPSRAWPGAANDWRSAGGAGLVRLPPAPEFRSARCEGTIVDHVARFEPGP